MHNIGLEITFWTVLSVYLLAQFGVFRKSRKKSYSRKNKRKWKYQIGNIILKKKENDIWNRRHYVLQKKDVDSY